MSSVSLRILQDIDDFEKGVTQFQSGEMPPEEFKRLRLLNGVYTQRQEGFFMIRVKIPFGAITVDQMRRLAQVSERYSRAELHVTTRQDFQIYWLRLASLPQLMRDLAEVELASREAAGNTVRNVTACHLAGVCPDEAFDVTPYARAVAGYFLHHPLAQNLPRKFKIAFSGCEHDCGLAAIHDLGAVAQRIPLDGREQGFFRILVGGGLGSAPRLAQVLHPLVPAKEILEWTEAILLVFNEFGERGNRSRARLKFLLEKIGVEELRKLVQEKKEQLAENPDRAHWKHTLDSPSEGFWRHWPRDMQWKPEPSGESYKIWKRANAKPQKQPGYCAVSILLPQGDIKARALRELADLVEKLGLANSIRTTNQQNLVIRWVPEKILASLYRGLVWIGLATPGTEGIIDVTACPGTASCPGAITNSKMIGRTLTTLLAQAFGEAPEDLADVRIKVSGCPNSCAQYQLGTLGLYGAAKNYEGKPVPYYQFLVGGHINGAGPELAQFVMSLPAKRVPAALMHLVEWYRSEREKEETLLQFLKRKGPERIRGELEPFTKLVGFHQERDLYYDWGCDEPFTFQKPGPSEC